MCRALLVLSTLAADRSCIEKIVCYESRDYIDDPRELEFSILMDQRRWREHMKD